MWLSTMCIGQADKLKYLIRSNMNARKLISNEVVAKQILKKIQTKI